ncbi:hypothetical protein ACJRO7_009204 [Eucalyptus globulus]|uniref:Uncharacterized protein n=1 Tax=Eucalyptus globulus TaxID=34317 RepID=A0ABD3IUE4_EUCGL
MVAMVSLPLASMPRTEKSSPFALVVPPHKIKELELGLEGNHDEEAETIRARDPVAMTDRALRSERELTMVVTVSSQLVSTPRMTKSLPPALAVPPHETGEFRL